MSQETIPLTFEAIDQMSATLATITASLEKLTGAQDEATKASEKAAEKQDDQRSSLDQLERGLSIATKGIELAKAGWESAKAVYEVFASQIGNSLAEWDLLAKKSGQSASSLGAVSDANERASKAQKALYAELGKVIESTGILQTAQAAQVEVLGKLTQIIKDNEEAVKAGGIAFGQDMVAALQSAAEWTERNAETLARLSVALSTVGAGLELMLNSLKMSALVMSTAFHGALLLISATLLVIVKAVNAAANAVGLLTDTMREAETGLEGVVQNSADRIVANVGDMKNLVVKNFGIITTAAGDIWDALSDGEQFKRAEGLFKSLVATAQTTLGNAKALLSGSADKPAATTKKSPEQLALETGRAILVLEGKILDAQIKGDQLRVIELERRKAIAEASAAALGIEDKRTAALTRSLGVRQADRDATEKIKALDQSTLIELERLNKRILEAQRDQDAQLVAQLEHEKARLELKQQLEGITDEGLKAATQETEELRAQLEYEGKLVELDKVRREKRKAAAEEQSAFEAEQRAFEDEQAAKVEERARRAIKLSKERMAADKERIDAIGEQINAAFSDVGDVFGGAVEAGLSGYTDQIRANEQALEQMGETDERVKADMLARNEALTAEMEKQRATAERQIAAFQRGASAATLLSTNIAKIKVSNKGFADSQEEVSGALSGTVGLAGSLVSAFTDNVKTRAKWEAAFNAAAAIAAGALSFANPAYIPVAVGHAAAAVKFGLVASGAIGGGGGGGAPSLGGGGSASAAPAAAQSLDLDRERKLNAESIAEAIASEGRGGATVIQFSFDNALFAATSPEAASQIVELITPELQRRQG